MIQLILRYILKMLHVGFGFLYCSWGFCYQIILNPLLKKLKMYLGLTFIFDHHLENKVCLTMSDNCKVQSSVNCTHFIQLIFITRLTDVCYQFT